MRLGSSVIDQFDIHVSLKYSCFHWHAQTLQFGREASIQTFCFRRLSGRHEPWSAPFSAVAEERELADDQSAAFNFPNIEIHSAIVIFKNTQTGNFASQPDDILLVIFLSDAKKDQQSVIDLPDDTSVNGHRC